MDITTEKVQAVINTASRCDVKALNRFTKPFLIAGCRKLGLSVGGAKIDLMMRMTRSFQCMFDEIRPKPGFVPCIDAVFSVQYYSSEGVIVKELQLTGDSSNLNSALGYKDLTTIHPIKQVSMWCPLERTHYLIAEVRWTLDKVTRTFSDWFLEMYSTFPYSETEYTFSVIR